MSQDTFTFLQQFIRHLVTAIANASLYSMQHQQVGRLAEMCLENLELAMDTDVELSLMMVDSDIIFDAKQLDSSLYIARFARTLKAHGVSHMKFTRGISKDEILSLINFLQRPKGTGTEALPAPHIHLGIVEIRFAQTEDGSSTKKDGPIEIADMAKEEAARFAEIYEEVRKNKRLRVNGIFEIVSGFINAFKQVSDPLLSLAPLRALDEYTFTHSTNVCILNLAQAMALGIDGPLLQDIGIAAMLHDMGKLFIPEEILTKPGKLTDQEYELMKQHPVRGAQYLLDAPGVPRLAVVAAFEHHMRYDQTGYPKVPAGWKQSLCSQMTAVSDVFDALRTKRVYEGSVEMEEIRSIIANLKGSSLHPALTMNFLHLMDAMTRAKDTAANNLQKHQ